MKVDKSVLRLYIEQLIPDSLKQENTITCLAAPTNGHLFHLKDDFSLLFTPCIIFNII